MKNILCAVCAIASLVGCGSLKVSQDLATTLPISTTIDLIRTKDDKVPVIINPGRFSQDTVTYYIPKVVQGTYSISDFGKFVENFKVFNYSGEELEFTKKGENTWIIPNAKQVDKIEYEVNDTFDIENTKENTPFSPSGTNIDPENYVLNLHGFIGYFDVLKNNKYVLEVHSPAGLQHTSALAESSSEMSADGQMRTDTYLANRYFDITDNPMMYGKLDIEEFKVGDINIVLSVYSPNNVHSAADIKETVYNMMRAQKTYLGDVNSTPRYDIYLYLAPSTETAPTGFGALEHHTSTVVVLPEAIPADRLATAMIDVVSHEFFHIVTPLSVHSEDVHYFDYNNPTFSKHLWMYEGVTEYFASIFQVDQGLVSAQDFYDKLMEKIQGSKSFDDAMSFTMMSENILEPEYEKNYINVYQKGALIGMCIDILMREESNGTRGILSLMKELSAKYGKNKPFEDDNLIAEITKMTYPSVGNFLQKHVVGTTPIDYKEFFEKVGLTFENKKIETSYIQNGSTLIIAGDQENAAIFFTEEVDDNSFWAENGVKPLDIIKNVNGSQVTLQNANAVLSQALQWKEGDDVNIELEREGTEIIIKTKLTKSYTNGRVLTEAPDVTEKQKEMRNSWLRG